MVRYGFREKSQDSRTYSRGGHLSIFSLHPTPPHVGSREKKDVFLISESCGRERSPSSVKDMRF